MALPSVEAETKYPALKRAAFYYPAIDNHAHPFLKAKCRASLDFEGLISEAEGDALREDSIHTLACFRATAQLAGLFELKEEPSWNAVTAARNAMDYTDLCRKCMEPTGIQCILIDDGLGGVADLAEDYSWHDQFTYAPTKRICRIEVVAQEVLADLIDADANQQVSMADLFHSFTTEITRILTATAADPEVVGFKSVACYRTGLNIAASRSLSDLVESFSLVVQTYMASKNSIRLAEKHLNDHIVCIALGIAAEFDKPVQFHTGLGDSDITLTLASPAHMQPIIKAYPRTKFVLLHSSYPYTRDAGYLTAVYKNVYLDFGEVFPFVSEDGQRSIVRQLLELTPTNKIMWSTDGHWWPESYYLGAIQAREALYHVLAEYVDQHTLTEQQAVDVVQNALFHNANRVYNLGLQAHIPSNMRNTTQLLVHTQLKLTRYWKLVIG